MPVTYETSTDGALFPVFPASSPEEQAQAMAFQQQRDALRGQGLSPHQASIQAWARVMPGRSFPGPDTLPGGIPFHPRPPLKEWVPWGPISGWTLVLLLSAIGWIAARHRLRRPTRFAPWFGLWALFEGIFLVLYRL